MAPNYRAIFHIKATRDIAKGEEILVKKYSKDPTYLGRFIQQKNLKLI